MSLKCCVIGLGRFGYQVATTLAQNNIEVLAIDSNESIIASIRDEVTQAICMRITDEASLRSVGVDQMDIVIVSIGENFAQSIIITVLLKKALKIPKIIARAVNDVHKEILKLVGADRIVLPEKEIGVKLADAIASSFTDLIRVGKELLVGQINAPAPFVGKKVKDLHLFEEYQVHCIGLKDAKDTTIILNPDHIIKAQDKLFFAGNSESLQKISTL